MLWKLFCRMCSKVAIVYVQWKETTKITPPTKKKKKVQAIQCTEHITWLGGDTEFLLECCKNISQVSVLFFQFFLLCFQCVSQSHKFGINE